MNYELIYEFNSHERLPKYIKTIRENPEYYWDIQKNGFVETNVPN
jgi:hypothetical protein